MRWPLIMTPLAGLAVAALAIAYAQATGKSSGQVLFSGQTALPSLIRHGATYTVGALLLLMACKGLAYCVSLSSFRGGPVFPAMFIGAAGGIALSHLPGLPLVAGVAMGIGAMSVVMLTLPLTSVLLASLLLASDGLAVMPLVIVAVVVAYVTAARIKPAEPTGRAAGRRPCGPSALISSGRSHPARQGVTTEFSLGYAKSMLAITAIPGRQGSAALTDMPEPPLDDGPILVQTQAIGVCGTDAEIINGDYGWAPPGEERLIIGHESLGKVIEAAPGTGFSTGDLVVGIVRRPDPVPCPPCAAGDWDMCANGLYTERGIKSRHGYASDRYRIHPEYLVAVDPALGNLGVLLEPATVVAKAWDHIEKIGRRSTWSPSTVLITGAGPIGLLAALMSTQRGYDTT